MIHSSTHAQRLGQNGSATQPENPNKKPDHVNNLLWNLSTPQERIKLLDGMAPSEIQPSESPSQQCKKTTLTGIGDIPSYTGDLPSPLQVMWYAPEGNELLKLHYPDSEIRSWVQDAAAYHDVPPEMLATIIQQENAPSSSKLQQFLQFGERSATTFSAIVDEITGGGVPDKISGGSSGIANMKRETLRNAADYVESTYGRPVLPDDVRHRAFGWNQDTRIPGDDLKADLYYASAVLRQLIDNEMGPNYCGPINEKQAERIMASYNGSGPLAQEYGKDAITTLRNAAEGKGHLYFYEKP